MAKRANGGGTVFKHLASGKWAAQFVYGFDDEGKQQRLTKYANTKAEAQTLLAEMQDQSTKGLLIKPDKVTVLEWAKRWLGRKEADRLAASTLKNYRQELAYAIPSLVKPGAKDFGAMRLQDVKPVHIQNLLDRLAKEGRSPAKRKEPEKQRTKAAKEAAQEALREAQPRRPLSVRTRRMVLAHLRALFQEALRLDVIHRNPVEVVKVKALPAEPVGKALQPGQVALLLDECDKNKTGMGLFFRLLLTTGLRKGEALALTWGDVDLVEGTLRVTKTYTGKGATGFSKPKTRGSKRVVVIPHATLQRLKEEQDKLQGEFTYQEIRGLYLFGLVKPFGVVAPNHALKRMIERIRRLHPDFPSVRVHDLRHTYGSLALSSGAPLEVVSERLGHANPTITLNVYRHVLEHERKAFVLDIDSLVRGQPKAQAAN